MENQVIFRDRQEFEAGDLNNLQTYVDEAFQHVVMDAITTERMFVGLGVTQKSATELTIAAGRLWDGPQGKVFRKDAAEDLSIFSYLPVSDQKYLTLSVIGQTVETDVEPRDFLIDLSTGQTEPRAVAMTSARTVAVLVTAGLESTTPQKPDAPTGYTTIAQVLLGTSGILDITLASNNALMRLFDVNQAMLANASWIAGAAPKLASLMSDMASLADKVKTATANPMVLSLAAEVAVMREQLSLPASYAAYDADMFADTDKSAVTDPDYRALVYFGLHFPWAGETEQQLALFNPYDTSVKNKSGLLLPAYTEVARLALTGYAGALALAQYQYQTLTTRQCTRTRVRTTYGQGWMISSAGTLLSAVGQVGEKIVEEVYEGEVPEGVTLGTTTSVANHLQSLGKDNGTGRDYYWSQNVTTFVWTEDYCVIDSTTSTITGCINAQTFLNSQYGWLTKIGLNFTAKSDTGAVTLYVMETANGLPNHERVLGSVTVEPGDISVMPSETLFEFAQPLFLAAGKRYALVLVTGGAHSVAVVEGTKYSQGTLFYSTDGEYFQGDYTKDLMMSLYFAQFSNPRTVVDLAPISLADGISTFDILTERIQPDATSVVLEYQPSGTGDWLAIEADTTDGLLGLPAMCRMRAVFNGTADLMPCLGLSGSKLRAKRPATSFKHVSTERTLTAPSADISVIVRLEGWDAAKHTCTVTLVSGGVTYAGTITDEALDDTTLVRTVHFTPNTPDGISAYTIHIEGTTSTALAPFVVAQRMDVAI